MPLDTDMYKALNEAWEKQQQKVTAYFAPTSFADGFRAGWQAGLKEKEKGD